jgi:hypothetical protein
MSVTGCEPTTAAMTSLLARPDVANALRALMAEGAPIKAHIDAMLRFADSATAENVATEFRELPMTTASLILQAWQLADSCGKRFEVVSAKPAEVLEFARHNRVRIVVDSEDGGIRVAISHVPGRHAAWYAPVALSA